MSDNETLILPPKQPLLPELFKQFSMIMDEEGVTLADLLAGLEEERKAIYQELYGETGGLEI